MSYCRSGFPSKQEVPLLGFPAALLNAIFNFFHLYKVLNEQHKLNNLLEVKSPPEIEQIHKETAHMKNELKVRTRLNKLQSAKVRLLNTYMCS